MNVVLVIPHALTAQEVKVVEGEMFQKDDLLEEKTILLELSQGTSRTQEKSIILIGGNQLVEKVKDQVDWKNPDPIVKILTRKKLIQDLFKDDNLMIVQIFMEQRGK